MSGDLIPAVSAVVVRDDGRVLLVRRGKPPLEGVLTLPGGRLEEGETADEGAAREVREETGLEVRIAAYVTDVVVERYVIAVHLARPASDPDAVRASSDASEVVWCSVEALDASGVPEATRGAIRLALSLQNIPPP